MKQSLKKTLYNVAHSLIIILIVFDIVEFIGRDSFPIEELPFFFGIGGFGVGIGLGGFWEFGVEENFLRMPSSKGDLTNMTVCGFLAGILAIYIQPNVTFLWISSIISAIFVIWYIAKMHKTKHERPKINY